LEVIDPTLYNGHAPSRLSKFHAAATPREIFWIKRLHTGQLRTGGLNTSFGTWKRRVHFGNNPMKWRRAKDKRLRTTEDASESKVTAPQDGKSRTYGYRDWRRRCLFLCSLIQSKKFSPATLDKYSRKNLFKMREWLTYNSVLPTFATAGSKLKAALNSILLVRIDTLKRATERGKRVFKILWKSNLLQKIGIGSILRNDYIKSFLPSDFATALDDIYICNKLSEPLSRLLFNYKSVAKRLVDTRAPTQNCPCRKLYDKRFRPENKCVYTGDISLVEDPDLRQLLKYGPNSEIFPLGTRL
jgi:hypothetical protein